MPEHVALVIGPTGATGGPIAAALARRGWRVYGMSRTAPSGEVSFTHIAADLTDPTSCRRALATIEPVTHAFFAARAPFREGGVEDVEGNVAMLAATLDALASRSDVLEHVHLLEGIKWYGMHLGPYPTPSREDDPRHLPPNFYYDQQDLLSERAARAGWSWSASRPSFICDFAPNRSRNLITVLGAYAAICRELQVPLDFPGTAAGYSVLSELSDATCLAEAIIFISTHDSGKNAAFNVTNGDSFRWCQVWPLLAQWFEIPCGVPRGMKLAKWMADKGPVWDRIVARHELEPRSLGSLASWEFADFVFEKEWDLLTDTGKLRRAGFNACVDTIAMIHDQLDQYRDARLLPR
ncbi:SDR family oxidoreductase [Bradyrhizobium erythrophlei]|jgi:nucleoside-diphosphate-sugar epimerase|uniref:Nucleoside-diphosphate-sugar epimerase n=1 Tax=Bradyrhizobium erythrophlei TaxID=1437360 RepID=A0A1M5LL32_9BRAD|nr:SDR family oxidoreductase [Bradyrhizobium erythrophlei]SHG65761.1 Nucleoside-diphosphate-sugar epimerase [Bradyrhizobium erythrophlei]